jgi:hypothetical protein
MSSRNLQDAQVLNYSDVSTYHILWSDVVVIESSALGSSLEVSDDDDTVEATAKVIESKKPAKKSAKKKTAGRKAAAKTTTPKVSARKSAAKTVKRTAKKKGK